MEKSTAMNEALRGTIEERLAHLERKFERGKRTVTGMMMLLVSLIAWNTAARSGKAQAAGSDAGRLVAKDLTIVDDKGHPCIVLAVDKEGPGVFIADDKGHPRATLAVTERGPTVMNLNDEKGHTLVALTVTKDGPSVFLRDDRGNERAVLGSTSLEAVHTGSTEVTASSSLTLFNKEGNVIWRAP
jgi:hypothetical protein